MEWRRRSIREEENVNWKYPHKQWVPFKIRIKYESFCLFRYSYDCTRLNSLELYKMRFREKLVQGLALLLGKFWWFRPAHMFMSCFRSFLNCCYHTKTNLTTEVIFFRALSISTDAFTFIMYCVIKATIWFGQQQQICLSFVVLHVKSFWYIFFPEYIEIAWLTCFLLQLLINFLFVTCRKVLKDIIFECRRAQVFGDT